MAHRPGAQDRDHRHQAQADSDHGGAAAILHDEQVAHQDADQVGGRGAAGL
jgi:hypothetical protein